MYSNIRWHILWIAELYRGKSDPGDRESNPRVLALAPKTSSSWCCCSCNIASDGQRINSNLYNGFDRWQSHWLNPAWQFLAHSIYRLAQVSLVIVETAWVFNYFKYLHKSRIYGIVLHIRWRDYVFSCHLMLQTDFELMSVQLHLLWEPFQDALLAKLPRPRQRQLDLCPGENYFKRWQPKSLELGHNIATLKSWERQFVLI